MNSNNFEWRGRCGPMNLFVSDTTFAPSTVSSLLADEITIEKNESVIDVGCGSGILSIIAAKLGASQVFATDNSPGVVEVGSRNAESNLVDNIVSFYSGDLFGSLPSELRADVIIGDVSGIPDTLAGFSGWFPSGRGGGPRGSELPVRMLQDAARRLTKRGRIYLPTGSLQDEQAILNTVHSLFNSARLLSERRVPLPAKFARSRVVADLVRDGVISVSSRGSRKFWEARIWEVSGPT